MSSMNRTWSGVARLAALLTLTLVTGSALAQAQAADPATLRKRADRLVNDIRRTEQEVAFSEASMLRLDSDIEERISALVDVLAKTKDSVATDGRIAASRAAAVAALRRTIALYMAEREQRRQHGWDVSRLDKRIDLRLEQMAKIAASEGPGEDAGAGTTMLADVEMEEAMGSLKAGKFVGSMVQTRKEMVTELQSTVDLLTSRRDTLTLQMEVTPDAVEKEKLAKEIAYAEGLADKRRAQVTEILAMPELEEATPGGVGKAFEIEKALRDARRVLRASLMDLQKRATTRDYQQTRADYLRKQLAETRAAMEAK